MASNFIISTAARNAMCDALVDLIDAGASAGVMEFYEGSQPAGPDTATGETLLATCTFSDPAFGNSASGTATASAISDDSAADASGTATWFRCSDSNGTAVFDGTVGTSGSDINFNTVTWTIGDVISVTSFTVTQPAS